MNKCYFIVQVWGAGNAAFPGTHAEYVVVSSEEVKYFLVVFSILSSCHTFSNLLHILK